MGSRATTFRIRTSSVLAVERRLEGGRFFIQTFYTRQSWVTRTLLQEFRGHVERGYWPRKTWTGWTRVAR